MVAPTRMPQARGVKCDLCKLILASATWLDQTKLAKEVDEAQNVLRLIEQHNTKECPCIPKNIENLLVGSTHFEIHRLAAKKLDSIVHKKQYDSYVLAKQKTQSENVKGHNEILNDCIDCSHRESRFKTYPEYCDPSHVEKSKQQFKHLCRAIDYWRIAMDDQTHPFNSKLARRLGLTHHVIYACYLFKYYKVLDYQLITANLLLNVFQSIEGVTANAILHAHFLLVKSLLDCDQLQLARHHLKQATKLSNYNDKTSYEAILLNCVACELSFFDEKENTQNVLDELSELVFIKSDDKLQHYYARTLAISLILKYIHRYPAKSDHCAEFFHTFRYICAIMKRCYENAFEIVLADKDIGSRKQTNKESPPHVKQNQILDHSWIRFAICDFVYSTFDLLVEFYSRAGIPECLELIYNGLSLISFRNGSVYWQSRILAIGARLDLLCDKHDCAHAKFDILSKLVSYTDDSHLMNIVRLESETGFLSLLGQQGSVISNDVIEDILNRIKTCKASLMEKLTYLELYDAKSSSFSKTSAPDSSPNFIIIGGYLGKMSLTTIGIGIVSLLNSKDSEQLALELIARLKDQLQSQGNRILTYYDNQMIMEILIHFTDIVRSDQALLESVNSSHLFLEVDGKSLDIQSQLSSLTLNSEPERVFYNSRLNGAKQTATKGRKGSKLPLSRCSKRKGTYEVAMKSEENLSKKSTVRLLNVNETVSNFETMTKEEIVVSYIRNSEPNPDFNLYRRAHELMMCFRLSDEHYNYESILYHMSESATANTLRYRWMMYEEQSLSPFDQSMQTINSSGDGRSAGLTTASTKHLGFCNTLVNQDNVVKSMIRTIPDDFRLNQLKYILDKRADVEHLLCVCYNNNGEQIYVHARRSLTSDDFFNDATALQSENDIAQLTIPNRLVAKIGESKRSLLSANHRTRIDRRQQIESDIGIILHDVENDWLGPFRFLFCGKVCDASYNNLIHCLIEEVKSIMGNRICRSASALRICLENAPLLSRDEFCQVIATLFSCDLGAREPRECFNKWLKTLELYMTEHNISMNKTEHLKQLGRGQVGMILDNKLELLPFESLPVIKIMGQGLFRVPSLRLFSIMSMRRCSPIRVSMEKVAYVLDPAHNLAKTRERFDNKLRSQKDWVGTIGHPPTTEELERWLLGKQLFIFIGHGAGMAYYNKLCKGRGLGYLPNIECAEIVMGCSSGRMVAEGPRLESFGVGWLFVFQGSPCYMGLLWDVTDHDIDKFLDALLDKWMPSRRWSSADKRPNRYSVTEASSQARQVCQLKLLVGSAPVVYGLPVWCKD